MTQSRCRQITDLLVDYVDGRLSPAQSADIAEHLAECPQCQLKVEALKKSLALADLIWQDNLDDISDAMPAAGRKITRPHFMRPVAVAAGILIVFGLFLVFHADRKPAEAQLTFAQIEFEINQHGMAAKLLAATEMLAKHAETEPIVQQQYRHIVKIYPKTSAAAQAKLRIKN